MGIVPQEENHIVRNISLKFIKESQILWTLQLLEYVESVLLKEIDPPMNGIEVKNERTESD